MLVILALVLALIFVPWPWNFAVVMGAAVCELSLVVVGVRYSRRRRARVGVEALIGANALVVSRLAPEGQVKVNGELWQARSERPAQAGESVRVIAVSGLTLEVQPR